MRFKLRSQKTNHPTEPETQKKPASFKTIADKLQDYKSTEGKANYARCSGKQNHYNIEEVDQL